MTTPHALGISFLEKHHAMNFRLLQFIFRYSNVFLLLGQANAVNNSIAARYGWSTLGDSESHYLLKDNLSFKNDQRDDSHAFIFA